MSENRNDPAPEAEGGEPRNGSPDQPAAPAQENTAPTQPLYGQYGTPQEPGSQPFAVPGGLPYGQTAPADGAGTPQTQGTESSTPQQAGPWDQTPGQIPYGQPQGYPGYGAQPSANGYPGGYQAPVQQPGKTMGIVGLILSCLFFIPFASLVGMILSIVAFVQSRKARISNGPALAGIIIGGVVFVLTLIAAIAIFVFAVDQVGTFFDICEERGPGTHYVDGGIYDCSFEEFEQSL